MFRWHWLLIFIALAVASSSPSFAVTRQLTYPDLGFSDGWAVYSPRGDKVAFARAQNGLGMLPTVFVADISTGAVDSLVTDLPAGWNPNGGLEWSPDGRQIAFMADKVTGAGQAIWVADVPGPVVPRIVASCPNSNGSGRFSLDSNGTIYFFGGVSPRCPNGGIEISIQGNMFDGGHLLVR